MKLNLRKIRVFYASFFILLTGSFIGIGQEQSPELPIVFQLDTATNIMDLAWNFDSTLLAIVDRDDTVLFINIETGKNNLRLSTTTDEIYVIQSIAWSTIRNHLLIANNQTKIWDYTEGGWLDSFEFPSAIEFEEYTTEGNVDWHPDGNRFAILLRECEERNPYRPGARVEIWNTVTSSSFQIADCVWTDSNAVKWNPQGTQLAVSGFAIFDHEGFVEDEEIEIWDVDTRERVLTISDLKDPSGLAWSPDGEMIAFTTVIGITQFIQVRDVTDGEIVTQTEVNLGVYVPLAWHPSENLIATGGQDGSVRIWDASDGSELIELPVHEDTVNDVGWSPDGSMLASVGRDGRLFVWRTSDLIG